MTQDTQGRVADYVIIGAMKCGTSTLAAQLGAQDGVFMTTPKEPNFFSDDDVFAQGLAWYHDLFAAARPGDLTGEASTHYTKLPDYPQAVERLAGTLTLPKLIYLIRDPVQRAISHYIHEWTMGVITGDLDGAVEHHPALVSYGCYAMQIAPWIARFGPDAVHIDTLEAMKADPQGVLGRVGRFLGRDDLVWVDDLERMNASAERLQRRALDRWLIDNPVATALRRALVPQALRDRVKKGRRMEVRPTLAPATRARLEQTFAQDHAQLRQLFPDRPDLDAAYPFLRG